MLGLKLATDPRWVELVESNISEVLTDHAFCEQKALSNAISIVVNYPEHTEIVQQLLEIAQEELQHFKQVHQIIVRQNLLQRLLISSLNIFIMRGYFFNVNVMLCSIPF